MNGNTEILRVVQFQIDAGLAPIVFEQAVEIRRRFGDNLSTAARMNRALALRSASPRRGWISDAMILLDLSSSHSNRPETRIGVSAARCCSKRG